MAERLLTALAVLALLTASASAQMPMPSMHLGGDKPPATPEQIAKQKAIDEAYRSASKKIPEKKATADPWGNVRAAPGPSQSQR